MYLRLGSQVQLSPLPTVFKKKNLFILCIRVWTEVSVYEPHACSDHRGQKRALDSVELELQTIMSYPTQMIGTEPWSSVSVTLAAEPSLQLCSHCLAISKLLNSPD